MARLAGDPERAWTLAWIWLAGGEPFSMEKACATKCLASSSTRSASPQPLSRKRRREKRGRRKGEIEERERGKKGEIEVRIGPESRKEGARNKKTNQTNRKERECLTFLVVCWCGGCLCCAIGKSGQASWPEQDLCCGI